MINLKNKSEIEKLYAAGQIVKDTLFLVEEHIRPGISTLELDKIAEDYIRSQNAIPCLLYTSDAADDSLV